MNNAVGLIGLGLVGSALAERFTSAGFELIGYDIDPQKVDALTSLGMVPAQSPRQVAESSRRIVLSLPDSSVVDSVVEGTGGLLESSAEGHIIVDTTTADPERSKALADRIRDRQLRFLDATILGSSRQVRESEILLMVGGDSETLEACTDIFSTFASKIVHMGSNGKGAEAKLVVNLVLGLNRLVLAEGILLGEKAGVDPRALLDVLRSGVAYSAVMDTKGEKMIAGDFAVEGKLEQHLKDVGLILDLGLRSGTKLPLSALHSEILRSGIEQGYGPEDNSAVIKVLRNLSST